MEKPKIRTLLIDDSGLIRILLADVLRADENIEVIATASNGLEGVEKVKALRPDVVITDMVMPKYDGLYVVQQLMKETPLPIILMSSVGRTDPKVFDALREGAFDFVEKPHSKKIAKGSESLLRMVHEASMTDYLKIRQRTKERNSFDHTFESQLNYDIIAIGASTGGPSAVEMIVNNLPHNLTIPIIIAQHMPQRFIESFAARLANSIGMQVSVAQEGEALSGNHIYLAPGKTNMRIDFSGSNSIIRYVPDHYQEFNHPSINCLFESVASMYGRRAIGVVLTGMGKDGTNGLGKIREAGGLTLSQDESSCAVYGMPRSAFESGAARYQVPLTEISNFIVSAL
jgi:two-component system, chemotaxis family, protein-glutamate methylesterase/glutaminase